MGEEGCEPSGIVGGESSLSSGSANRPPPEQEEPTHHQLQPQEEEEGISSTSWKSYISEDLPRTVVQSTDSALRSARSLQHTSQTHLRTLRDFIPEIGSHYRTYEDAFFSRVKDGLMDAKEHPFVAGGVAVTTSLLLMRDLQKLEGTTCLGHHRKMCNLFYPSTIQQSKSNYHKISGSRRFLFHHTFGRLQSEEAQFVRAEKHVKELNLSVDLMKNESRKLLERAALAEKDMRHGQSELMNAGTQIQRLARSVYKAEVQSSNLMDGLRELPGREALRLRAEVASLASHLRQERVAMNRRVLKISELGLPV